jgi:hypothetical protein
VQYIHYGGLLAYGTVASHNGFSLPLARTITCIPPNCILFAFLRPPLSIANLKITAALPNDFPFPHPICLSFICYFSLLLLLPSLSSAVRRVILYFPFSHHQHKNRLVFHPSSSGLLLFVIVVRACIRHLPTELPQKPNLPMEPIICRQRCPRSQLFAAEFADAAELPMQPNS